jgi:GPN-loop GTPase
MFILYIIGPAGSGKSTLTKELFDYITAYNHDLQVITINLDPAVRTLPYAPSIDIQDYVTVDEIIEKTQLGPNGAIIAATDKMVDYLEDIKYEIGEYNNPDIILVDTPGQMELFAFRNTGPMVASALGFGAAQRGIIFCYDSLMCTRPNGFVSTMLLAASVQYRFSNVSQINVLTKIDLLPQEKMDQILSWIEDEDQLGMSIESSERDMLREITMTLYRAFQDFGSIPELVPISSIKHEGMDELWGAIQRVMNDDSSSFY